MCKSSRNRENDKEFIIRIESQENKIIKERSNAMVCEKQLKGLVFLIFEKLSHGN